MACPDDNTLAAFACGTLAAAERDAVMAHLAGCAGCAEVVEAMATARPDPDPTAPARPRRAEDPLPRAGERIGRFIVNEELGRGGMSVVYGAVDPELGRRVAIKLVSSRAYARSPDGRARLAREAQALARLAHPNVIVVHEVGTVGERMFIVMELVAGTTLRERTGTAAELLALYVAAGRGLAAAHAAGIVHRDFKPSNVLVGADGRPRVADFGLARAADDLPGDDPTPLSSPGGGLISDKLTRTGALVGTPAYMAPEQHRGERADARSDQFSFCVALHEALYGRRPYDVEHDGAWRLRPPPARRDVPARARQAIVRGMALVPEDRWPSMDALLDELAPPPRRWRAAAFAGALGAIAVVSVGVAALRQPGDACAGAVTGLAGTWDEARRRAVRGAFLASAAPSAARSFDAVARRLDGFAAAHAAEQRAVCEATLVRRTQSAEARELRLACLAAQTHAVGAMVDVLAAADRAVVENATAIARDLPAPEGCGDVALLRREPPAREAAPVERKLARAAALRWANKLDAVAPLVEEALAAARAGRWPRLEAQALYTRALARNAASKIPEAADDFREVVRLSEIAGQDRMKARAWSALAYLALGEDKLPEARHAVRLGEAALQRAGVLSGPEVGTLAMAEALTFSREGNGVEAMRAVERAMVYRRARPSEAFELADALVNAGAVYSDAGRIADAEARFREAQGLLETLTGEDHPTVVRVLNNLAEVQLARGDLDGALATTRRALVIKERLYEPGSLSVAISVVNLGDLLLRRGDVAGAEAAFRRGNEIFVRLKGKEHLYVSFSLGGLGRVALARGALAEARAALEEALRIAELRKAKPAQLAELRFALGRALWDVDRARARALVERARGDAQAAGDTGKETLREIAAWDGRHAAR